MGFARFSLREGAFDLWCAERQYAAANQSVVEQGMGDGLSGRWWSSSWCGLEKRSGVELLGRERMSKKPSQFSKIFGSGPTGLLISLVLLFIAYQLNARMAPAPLSGNRVLLNSLFLVSVVATLAAIIWSVKSLPASERGKKLSTRGAFKYVRHPLYAAFLSIFNFGLALFLNSYIYLLWAVILHPVWHLLVHHEERLMVDIFGQSYVEYQRRTGRFLPRLW
jgi:protein-S-isoprenylcysteine O-methyltransferase Ste14